MVSAVASFASRSKWSWRASAACGTRRARLPAYGCGSYATSRQSGQDYQEPLCELIPYISEFDRATELKKSERSGKIVQAHRKRVLYTAEEARAC